MKTMRCDKMPVGIYETNAELGQAAADDLAEILRTAVARRGHAAVVLATGNSQLTFMTPLRGQARFPWDK